MFKKYRLAFLIFGLYLVVGIATLSHYGISWDEPTHFKRGNAYLRYFLTGKSTYKDMPEYNLEKAKTDPNYHERSFWQIESFNLDYHLQKDGDHPVLNDILAAFTNFIFYQKLGILGDIEGYHISEVFISAMLVGFVYLFAAEAFGKKVGIFASLFMATYPLFWSESHFNIKDPTETAFFTISIYFIWKAIQQKRALYIIFSSIFTGFALSTKFNIVFAPFILIPWLAINLITQKDFFKRYFKKGFLIAAILFPLIVIAIFVAHWPYLWQDLIDNTKGVINYYQYIGLEDNYGSKFLINNVNLFAPRWILYTTQPIMLFCFLAGIYIARKKWKDKNAVLVLWLLFFSLPILRVMYPGTSIYSGVRQIMEYIPPMALVAGLGADFVISKIKYPKVKFLFVFLTFTFLTLTLVRLHPNENVYFNFISGGLKHQKEIKFPNTGFTFGNTYWQGVQWLNKNAPDGAKLALIQGTGLNIPPFTVRSGIDFSNYYWTGVNRGGEYLTEVIYEGELKTYFYAWEYVERMLDPVYEVKMDDVALLRVWKNDWEHTKEEFKKIETDYVGKLKTSVNKDKVLVEIPEEVILSRLSIKFDNSKGCVPTDAVFVDLSTDEGKTWLRERDTLSSTQMSQSFDRAKDEFWFFFAGKNAKFIRVETGNLESCILKKPQTSLKIFK
ncbi:MAG: Glycosyl transferase family 39 [Parcubacteria group bacterium GW2011_GWA1_38_7]|nr:MAG: Glycosyl transferase family 39 [Parcubacteria group bacterium GW2011_GWA1_38_7]